MACIIKYPWSRILVKVQRGTTTFFICLLLLLTSCNSRSVEELPHSEFSQRYIPLTDGTVDEFAEIDAWKILEPGYPISLVRHNVVLNQLTVVSELVKKVALFSINEEKTISQQIVEIPDLRVFDINRDGNQLLVGMSGQRLNEWGEPQQFYHWIALWDIPSGSIDRCFYWKSCIGKRTDNIEIADTGAVMDAETVVTYGEDAFSAHVLSPGGVGGGMPVNSPDSDYWWHIGNVAVNSDLNRLAIVFQEGRIHLQKISFGNFPLGWWDVLVKGKENQLQPVQRAIFDPAGKWLAIIRGKDLTIWKISGWKRKVLQEQIDNVRGMQFNPSGELLFVATNDAIQVINPRERDIIFEAQTPGITSLDISDDNRLLFWGDENGTVHMWGIPVSQ